MVKHFCCCICKKPDSKAEEEAEINRIQKELEESEAKDGLSPEEAKKINRIKILETMSGEE